MCTQYTEEENTLYYLRNIPKGKRTLWTYVSLYGPGWVAQLYDFAYISIYSVSLWDNAINKTVLAFP